MGRNMNGRLHQWLFILVSLMILLRTESFFVDITYVQSAVAKGGGKKKTKSKMWSS